MISRSKAVEISVFGRFRSFRCLKVDNSARKTKQVPRVFFYSGLGQFFSLNMGNCRERKKRLRPQAQNSFPVSNLKRVTSRCCEPVFVICCDRTAFRVLICLLSLSSFLRSVPALGNLYHFSSVFSSLARIVDRLSVVPADARAKQRRFWSRSPLVDCSTPSFRTSFWTLERPPSHQLATLAPLMSGLIWAATAIEKPPSALRALAYCCRLW